MEVRFTDSYTKKIEHKEKFKLFSNGHKWLERLPLKWRYKVIKFFFKIGIIKQVGYGRLVNHTTGQISEFWNIIPDVGVTQVRDILAGTSSNLPKNIEFGTGTTTPAASDTDLTTPLTNNDRLVGTVTTPGSFEIRVEVFINSTYGPGRPYTIEEMGLFFDPEESGIIFAHALVSPGFQISGTDTADCTYGILLR